MNKATYRVRDERGQERVIEAPQMEGHFRQVLTPILSEIGAAPSAIAGEEIGTLVNRIIGAIRDGRAGLEVARLEFRKLKAKREEDYQTILNYIHAHQGYEDFDAHRRAA